MQNIGSRRDLLKLSPLALAAAATPAAFAFQKTAAQKAATKSPLLFDVRTYGATGDGKTLDTLAINKAIEAAAAVGGGTVILPAGNYLCFSIRLKSSVELHLTQGAVIIAANSPKPGETTGYNGGAYDAAEPKTAWDAYQDFGHNHWHNSLLWGEDLHDISITGPGLIWGRGLSFGANRAPRGDYPVYRAEQAGVGNKAIALKNCRNVQLRNFSLLKGGHFAMLLTGVDNLILDNLTIDTDRDGMDIDCCKNVRVSNCTVNAPWDDAICPKSSYALGYSKPTENVTIANCFISGCYLLGTVLDGTYKKFPATERVTRNGRIKCGTESNGGFRNISISNCAFEGSYGIALESVDGALCEDIAISNITMRDATSAPLFLRLGARLRGPVETTHVGTMQRILVDNLTSYNAGAEVCSILSGIPNFDLRDIKLSNLYLHHQGGVPPDLARAVLPEKENGYPDPSMFGSTPSQGLYLRHITHLELSHIEVAPATPDPRPSFYLQNVTRADCLALTAPTTPAAFTLNQVTDLRIAFSRAAKDTTLSTADAQTL